MLVRYGRFFVS